MMHSPFQTAQKIVNPIKVVSAGGFNIHLLSRGYLTLTEDYETDAVATREAEVTEIFLEAIKACASKEGIKASEAREKVFPSQRADGVEVEGADLMDYLDVKPMHKLIQLQKVTTKDDVAHVATLMIRERLVYPVVVKAVAKQKSNQLGEVEPLRFNAVGGNRLRFGETIVEVDGNATYDEEMVVVKPLLRQIEAGEVGYLLDAMGGFKVGNADWTLEHTKSLLSLEQQRALYDFYKSERGDSAASEDAGEENLTMPLLESDSSLNESQSTGLPSIGESNPTESPTNDSMPRTLATSQPG
jgi:hypothetical protein